MRCSSATLLFLSFLANEVLARRSRGLKKGKNSKKSTLPLIERLYGPFLSDEERDNWIVLDEHSLFTWGMSGAIRASAAVDRFTFRNTYGFSNEDISNVCLVKCENNDLCEYFALYELPGAEGLDDTGFFICTFYNPAFGPLFVSEYPQVTKGNVLSEYDAFVNTKVFYKEGTLPPPTFDDYACNVPSDLQGIVGAITCATCLPSGNCPPELPCQDLLTDDFVQYMLPSVQCIAREAGNAAVQACLGCGEQALNGLLPGSNEGDSQPCETRASRVCNPSSSKPGESYFGPGGLCESVCPTECLAELQQFVLCTSGQVGAYTESGTVTGGNCVMFGIPGLPPFTCPGDGFETPTNEQFLASFQALSSTIFDE